MIIKISVPSRFRLKKTATFRTILMQNQGEIHYIGGADVLPAPLTLEEETRTLACLGTEEEKEARSRLIEHNLRLVVYIAKKFDNTSVGVEDLISIGTIGLIKAINTFDPAKNIKLATYASRCIENEILMYLRRTSKTKLEVSIDEPLNVDWDGNELLLSDILGTDEDVIYKDIEDEIEKDLLKNAIDHLNPREKKIVELRFGLKQPDGMEMTQKEVADLMGISQSYISRLEKKIMKRLKKEIVRYEEKEGAAAKEVSKVSFCSSSRRLRYVSGFSVKAFVDHVTEGVCIGLVRQIPSSHQVILDQFKPLQLQLFPEKLRILHQMLVVEPSGRVGL